MAWPLFCASNSISKFLITPFTLSLLARRGCCLAGTWPVILHVLGSVNMDFGGNSTFDLLKLSSFGVLLFDKG